jgi:hypothetical protein
MEKKYKVTYKTYFNDRLKKVYFHGALTYPLYVQLTFDRKTIIFKSYYFDLFSKPRYVLFMNGRMHGPSMKEIIKKEINLLDFIINKNLADCSLEKLKADYTFYCKDLCDEMESGFIDYLFIFFQDKGMPAFATSIKEGIKFRIAYEVVRDFKIAFVPILYSELIANSFYYSTPYLGLYGFMQETKKWPLLCLTVMEWEDNTTKALLALYLNENYKNLDADSVTGQVNQFIQTLK